MNMLQLKQRIRKCLDNNTNLKTDEKDILLNKICMELDVFALSILNVFKEDL